MSATGGVKALIREAEQARERLAALATDAKGSPIAARALREVLVEFDRAYDRAMLLVALRHKWDTITFLTRALRRFIRARMKAEEKLTITRTFAATLRDQNPKLAAYWQEIGIEWTPETLNSLMRSKQEPRTWVMHRVAEYRGVSYWTVRSWFLKRKHA